MQPLQDRDFVGLPRELLSAFARRCAEVVAPLAVFEKCRLHVAAVNREAQNAERAAKLEPWGDDSYFEGCSACRAHAATALDSAMAAASAHAIETEQRVGEILLRDLALLKAGLEPGGQVAQVHYSCFISYSTKDQRFAERLAADLIAAGVRCWFAPHEIHGGQKLHEQIEDAIQGCDKLLLILSEASMNSNWVKTEIANARAREMRQTHKVLFPITLVPFDLLRAWKCFDAEIGIDSAREIREYFVPDFSDWLAPASYAKAFQRLLADLKALPSDQAEAHPAP